MRTVLSADLPVVRVAVFAELAWMERRPELGLLCRAARDSGKRITVATVQSALPGLADAGAKNVIAWCRTLGLCDAAGGLTALGEDVAESNEAPVPEQGVVGLWMTQHPVLGRRVLSVERLASTRDQRFESIEPLAFEPDRGRVFASALDSKARFLVRDLPSNQGQARGLSGSTEATCRLRWTLDFDQGRDQWQLDGLIEAPQGNGRYALRPIQHDPESDGLDLWSLAASWATGPLAPFGRWLAGDRRLAVGFQGLTEEEQERFQKTLSLPRVEIPGKGVYSDVRLEGVPLCPRSPQDAQRWAMARLDTRLARTPGFLSRAALRALFAELTEETPLERHGPTLPSHDELLAGAARDPERAWALAAPVDLAPAPVSPDELSPLRIGAPAPSEAAASPGLLRVPYRCGWSMRRLVDQLLAGAAPRRVLLCDRYVRGAENLDALRILVAALRAVAPGVGVAVWTGEEEADLAEIAAITGSPARGYRAAFGRSLPHDRYLLVKPAQGQGFGWQMSNSPLNARADVAGAGPDTPLRWKDLIASRVSAEALEPALSQWLTGGAR